jgi:hypothetical protein
MIKLKAFVYGKLGAVFVLAVTGLLLGAGAKLIGQSVFWLKNGYWEPYSILSLLRDLSVDVPSTPNLLGVQKMIDDVLSWPALVGLATVAGLCMGIGAFFLVLGEEYEGQLQQQADAALRAKNERDAQEQRRADQEQRRAAVKGSEFDFSEPIEQLRPDG